MLFGCEQPFLWGERCVTSQKTAAKETIVGGARWLFVCLATVRSFPPLTRRLSLPFNLRDRGLRSRGIFEQPQSSTGPGRVHPGAVTVDGLTPLPLTNACTRPYQDSGGGHSPTSKRHHQLFVTSPLGFVRYIYIYIASARFSQTCGVLFFWLV